MTTTSNKMMIKTASRRLHPLQSWMVGLLCALVAMVGPMACSDDDETQKHYEVTIEVNPDADFSQYQTFDVVDPTEDLDPEDTPDGGVDGGVGAPEDFLALKDELLMSVVKEMEALGLTLDTENPDLMVSPFMRVDEKTSDVMFYSYFYGYYWGYEFTWTVNIDYNLGTLILDVVSLGSSPDINDDVLVFRGIAEGVLSREIDVVLLQTRNAVDAIFAGWPEAETE
jgi:hypothetical protein